MKAYRSAASALPALVMAWVAPASAQVFEDRWFIGARAGIVSTDRALRRDGDLRLVSFGRTIGPVYAVELEGFRERLVVRIDQRHRQSGLALNLLTINREPLWDPYFLIGVGALRLETPRGVSVRSRTHPIAQAAIGGQWELILPERVLLRVEIRIRVTGDDTGRFDQDDDADATISFGLTLPF